jgi:hypothetical protein
MPALNAQGTPQVAPPAGFPAVGAPPIVTVTSNGAEPRKALRYVSTKGHREHMVLDFLMAITMTVGDTSVPETKLPSLRAGADIEVTDVSPAGDLTVSTTFTDANWIAAPDMDPALLTRLNSVTTDLKGVSGTTVMTSRGIAQDVKIDASKVSNPELMQTMSAMQQMMQNVSEPLPEEPVGVGATWQVRSSVNGNGVQTFNTVSLQLIAMDDTSYTLKFTLDQTAPHQTISNPALGGAAASIDSSTGTGTGTTKVQFDMLSPKTDLDLNSKTIMSFTVADKVQQINTAISMKMAITPGTSQK